MSVNNVSSAHSTHGASGPSSSSGGDEEVKEKAKEEIKQDPPSVSAAHDSAQADLDAERAQAQKLVQQVDVGLLAFTLWSAAHGFADLLISHHVEEFPAAEKDLHQSMHFAMRAALYGVTTPKGRAWLNRSAP